MGIYRVIVKRIDTRKFIISFSPVILLGGITRALADHGVFLHSYLSRPPGYFLSVTPGIYLFMFSIWLFIYIFSLSASRLAGKREKWHQIALIPGIILDLYALSLYEMHNIDGFMLVVAATLISTSLVYLLSKTRRFRYIGKPENILVIFGHMLDASATFVGVDIYGFYEQHVVPRFFFELTGTAAVLYILKLLVLIPGLKYIDDEIQDKDYNIFMKLVIFILGFGPGSRDLLTLGMQR